MAQFDRLVQGASERLYGDERLRSNLTDKEANTVLGWAAEWIGKQVAALSDEDAAKHVAESELDRVRRAVAALNDLAGGGAAVRMDEAMRAVAASAKAESALTPEQVLQLASKLATASSKTSGDKATR